MVALRELSTEEVYAPGHRLCAGCGPSISMRMMTKAFRGPTVITNATGCVEVSTTIYPYTAWRVPWVHSLFENTAATASGLEAAYKVLQRKGYRKTKVDIIAVGGDGGTFDIGMQALSGALERGHDFVYVCYDNEAYMNTGIQRSGATPPGAATTTSPAGKVIPGKQERKKNLAAICAAHDIEYVATASIGFPGDYIDKMKRAIEVEGPAVVHVFAPCPLGWRSNPADSIKLAKLGVQTCMFPLYEIINGKYKLTMKIGKPIPISEYMKLQGRFRHLFKSELQSRIEMIQQQVNNDWNRLLERCGEKPQATTG